MIYVFLLFGVVCFFTGYEVSKIENYNLSKILKALMNKIARDHIQLTAREIANAESDKLIVRSWTPNCGGRLIDLFIIDETEKEY